jgi:hypothetical protein
LESGTRKIALVGIQRSLRFSGILLILSLGVELISLLWEKPLAFLFAFIGGAIFLVGILVYLYSLASAGA